MITEKKTLLNQRIAQVRISRLALATTPIIMAPAEVVMEAVTSKMFENLYTSSTLSISNNHFLQIGHLGIEQYRLLEVEAGKGKRIQKTKTRGEGSDGTDMLKKKKALEEAISKKLQ